MQIKEIKYNGFTETPSDYECPDGDLATVSGLVPEEEGLKAVQMPGGVFQLPQIAVANTTDYWTVAYIHENPGYKHYIVRHHTEVTDNETGETTVTDTFYWMNNPGYRILQASEFYNQTVAKQLIEYQGVLGDVSTTNDPIEIYQLNSTGNVLMILTSDGTYYFLWKGETDGYKSLGNHMPEPKLSFGLQGEVDKTQRSSIDVIDSNVWNTERTAHGGDLDVDDYTIQTDDFRDALTNVIMAEVNKFVATRSVNKGKFIFPFLVRYAYRLMDESLVMHSCPVLMITDTFCSPHVFADLLDSFHSTASLTQAMLYDLEYHAYTPAGVQSFSEFLGDWKEIIKSVDIFVSEPIYTYNQSGKISGWDTKLPDQRGFGVFRIPDQDKVYHTIQLNTTAYSRHYTSSLLIDTTDSGSNYGKREFLLARYTEEEIQNKIKDVHNFYLFKSIPVDEVSLQATVIKMPENYLAGITGRELMTDDFQSHDLLIPKYSFTYNSRQNIANITRKVSNPFSSVNVFCYTDYSLQDNMRDYKPVSSAIYEVYVFLKPDNKNIVVKGSAASLGYDDPFQYLYYPDTNAYKAVVHKQYNETVVDPDTQESTTVTHNEYYELPLTRHDFLNGAVYFGGWNPSPTTLLSAPTVTTDNTVEVPNKIYTSEVDNPFLFTAKGVNTVGLGTILGIRPAVKAMSPSQFGQFKFYVFSTDGVWTMEVSSTGYLQSPTMITPDVVNGAGESITQIDGSVLFATNRGIMMTAGSNTVCMSEILNSRQPFIPFGATAAADVLPKLRNIVPDGILNSVVPIRFLDYIADCRMVYDYTHQHIFVFNPSQPYAYVYSLKTKLWGLIPSTMKQAVFDYPSATVMTELVASGYKSWALLDYADELTSSDPTVSTVYQGLIITRPLKLDMPDVLKTVPTVIQRGMFEKGHVYGALYASRDLIHWTLVWSSVDHYLRGMHGTPYKYFRMALICNLTAKESLYGCSVGVIPRDTNNLR